jgi:uncharacterized protein with PIN domain
MLGYDTLLFGDGEDDELRRLRDESGRILLTRDSDFENENNTLILASDIYLKQLKTVVDTFELDVETYRYSICLECNTVIRLTDPSAHARDIPEWVVAEAHPLWQCPGCSRLYWAGSHLDRMDKRFEELFSS